MSTGIYAIALVVMETSKYKSAANGVNRRRTISRANSKTRVSEPLIHASSRSSINCSPMASSSIPQDFDSVIVSELDPGRSRSSITDLEHSMLALRTAILRNERIGSLKESSAKICKEVLGMYADVAVSHVQSIERLRFGCTPRGNRECC